ncbi:MAG: hemerythrin domain-containing protein [Candidatus Neomarinimicrobiota bacterium]
MSPTDQLKVEHEAIQSMLDILERICEKLDSEEDVDTTHPDKIIEFFRVFADKCHHGKEEAHLFPAMEQAGIPRHGGPVGVMLVEHDTGRAYVKGMAEGAKSYTPGEPGSSAQFVENAKHYIELLRQHIDKENNVLFPMADASIPLDRQTELLKDFDRVEHEVVGEGQHEKFHRLLEELQSIYAT